MSGLLFLTIISVFLFTQCNALSIQSSLKVRILTSGLYSTADGTISEEKTAYGSCPNAPKCKGGYKNKGCDGTGKIQGGIATVLPWWPIKVFRPCPSYLEAGYQYRREGQTMDQVLFSEPSEKMKRKIEAMRKQELEESKLAADKRNEKIMSDEEADAAQKLLNEKFGKK